jgi:hypothetical protein
LLLQNKVAFGALAAAAAGGAYFGVSHSPEDAEPGETSARGQFGAGVATAAALTGAGMYKAGVFKPTAKFAVVNGTKTLGKGLTTKTGMFVGGGAAIGAGIGAYASDDSVSGAAKGAAIGAGVGGAARVTMAAVQAHKAISATKFGATGMKAGVAGVAILGTLAVAMGAHALEGSPATSSYSSSSDSGETTYSDAPVHRRSASMNATGDVVLGLHRKRRG